MFALEPVRISRALRLGSFPHLEELEPRDLLSAGFTPQPAAAAQAAQSSTPNGGPGSTVFPGTTSQGNGTAQNPPSQGNPATPVPGSGLGGPDGSVASFQTTVQTQSAMAFADQQASSHSPVPPGSSMAANVAVQQVGSGNVSSVLDALVREGNTVARPQQWRSTAVQSGGGDNAALNNNNLANAMTTGTRVQRPVQVAPPPSNLPQPQTTPRQTVPPIPVVPVIPVVALPRPACDACFADGRWLAEQVRTPRSRPTGVAAYAAAAIAALPVFLTDGWKASSVKRWFRVRRASPN